MTEHRSHLAKVIVPCRRSLLKGMVDVHLKTCDQGCCAADLKRAICLQNKFVLIFI